MKIKGVRSIIEKVLKKKTTKKENHDDLKIFISLLEATGFSDFVRYLQSRKRIVAINFIAGVSRGFGIVVGMTIFVAIAIWVLNKLVDFPLIGQYFLDLKTLLEGVSTIR